MVELIKRNIHMNRWKGSASTQVTLDDDFIVPDTMDDLARIVISSGDIQVESVKNQGEKVLVKGRLVSGAVPQGRGRAADHGGEHAL